jgi:hypothetical protein
MKESSVNDYDFFNFMLFVRDSHCDFLLVYVTSVRTCYCMRQIVMDTLMNIGENYNYY